jgi:hypothetical protein
MKPQIFGARCFTRLSSGILLVTAVAKLLSTASDAPIMDYPDPLLGVSNRHALCIVAAIELVIVAFLFSKVAAPLKYLSTAWLGGSFLLYRMALAILKPGTPCKCLGTMTAKLHVDDRMAGLMLTLISCYLVAGGLWLFAGSRRNLPDVLAGEISGSQLE